jgi:hypothetical protein
MKDTTKPADAPYNVAEDAVGLSKSSQELNWDDLMLRTPTEQHTTTDGYATHQNKCKQS